MRPQARHDEIPCPQLSMLYVMSSHSKTGATIPCMQAVGVCHNAAYQTDDSNASLLSVCWSLPGKVEDSIRIGGLAEVKTQRIKTILSTLKDEHGVISMEYIRSMADDDIKAELTR